MIELCSLEYNDDNDEINKEIGYYSNKNIVNMSTKNNINNEKKISNISLNNKKTKNNDSKTKLIHNYNIKHKNLLLDSIESNNNITNLNKTEENINLIY